MKQHEISNQVPNKFFNKTFIFGGLFFLFFLFASSVMADASFSFWRAPDVSTTTQSDGKAVHTAWVYVKSSDPITDVAVILYSGTIGKSYTKGGINFSAQELSQSVFFPDLPANTTFSVSLAKADSSGNLTVISKGDLGSFTTTPDSAKPLVNKTNPTATVNFTYDKEPEISSYFENSKLIEAATLFIKTEQDPYESDNADKGLSLIVRNLSGVGTQIKPITFAGAGDVQAVTFSGLLPGTVYTVSMANGPDAAGKLTTLSDTDFPRFKTLAQGSATAAGSDAGSSSASPASSPASSPSSSSKGNSAFTPLVNKPSPNAPVPTALGTSTCTDGIDNDGDGRADYGGAMIGGKYYPPDPSCVTPDSSEVKDNVSSTIIPCTDKCDITSVITLLNNVLTFAIKVVLIPIFVIMIMYAGYQYLTAMGNPTKKADLKKLIMHLVVGLVIVLCSWLVVRTIMVTLGYSDGLLFFN